MSINNTTHLNPTWWEQTADFRSDHKNSVIAFSILLLPFALIAGLLMALQSGYQHWQDRKVQPIQHPIPLTVALPFAVNCDGSFGFFNQNTPSPSPKPWGYTEFTPLSVNDASFGASPLAESKLFSEFDLFENS